MSNVTTGSKRVHRSGAKNSADQTTALCGKVMAHRLFRTDAPANCKACDDAVIAEQNAPTAERIAELHPAATETPVPLDIPGAVRAYIEAEWRGASHAALSAMRGEITAALLAADPELSNTAAGFRFHQLVAEMRDNDSIGADLLAQMAPESAEAQQVSVDGPEGSGLRWHLMDVDGNPVTAGEHRALWSGQPRFTIAEHPEVQSWDGEVPLNIWITWVDDTRGYCRTNQLVSGWNWELEVIKA